MAVEVDQNVYHGILTLMLRSWVLWRPMEDVLETIVGIAIELFSSPSFENIQDVQKRELILAMKRQGLEAITTEIPKGPLE